jgi:hypothetical protein
MMPRVGAPLSEEELKELGQEVPEHVTVVWGATHGGDPIPRGVRAGTRVSLIGGYGSGFDAGGPSATLCRECGELLYGDNAGGLAALQSRHLSVEHSINAPMLP